MGAPKHPAFPAPSDDQKAESEGKLAQNMRRDRERVSSVVASQALIVL
jgi:hypothetical protein